VDSSWCDVVHQRNEPAQLVFPRDVAARPFGIVCIAQEADLARLPPSRKEDMPGYGNVCGMLAFGYEETRVRVTRADPAGHVPQRQNRIDRFVVSTLLKRNDRLAERYAQSVKRV
jgi:hypothetical protein